MVPQYACPERLETSSISDILFRWTDTYTTGFEREQKGSRNIEMSDGTRKRQGGRLLIFIRLCVFISAVFPLLVMAQQQDDGQWTMAAKNYANTRYSSLDQINASNVKNLKPAWTFSTGVLHGHEAAPLVVNNTMYVGDALAESPVCAGLDQARRADEMGVCSQPIARCARGSLL